MKYKYKIIYDLGNVTNLKVIIEAETGVDALIKLFMTISPAAFIESVSEINDETV